jgi:uncharacterized protein
MQNILLIDDIENSPNKTMNFCFDGDIAEINCITPVKAALIAKSFGEYIQIKGHVNCTVSLECDLCLEKYNYEMNFDIDEMYTKTSLTSGYTNSDKEFEIKDGQFITDLNGNKEIDIYDLLYQSVILNFPNKKVCGINCKGKDYLSEEDTLDPRLEVFNNLQINPKK